MYSNRLFSRVLFTTSDALGARASVGLQTNVTRKMSAFAKFMETIKEQVEKNKELQRNVKLLQDRAGQLGESETLRRAKEAYAKAKEGAESTTTIGSEKLRKSVDEIKKTAEKIGSSVSDTLKEVGETPFVKGTQEKISTLTDKVSASTEPIRKTKAYTNIRDTLKETVGDDASRYGGFVDKETRQRMKEKAMSYHGTPFPQNPEAGSSMVLHKDSAWKESWNKFKENNPIMQGIFNLKRNYQDSDNIFVAYTRAFTDRVSDALGSFFEENETAQAISQLKLIDPRFNVEDFLREAREYIVPEIMEAYLKGDTETLKKWCSEATYTVLTHGIDDQKGLLNDSKILDIRNVELFAARVLENGLPVLIISFNTQEVIVFRDKITQKIMYGRDDQIDQVTYACVITKQEDSADPFTNGWRIIEMAKNRSQQLLCIFAITVQSNINVTFIKPHPLWKAINPQSTAATRNIRLMKNQITPHTCEGQHLVSFANLLASDSLTFRITKLGS
ncbi:6792_t:CDS:10 [Acaulospora morrowiae]|uniref:6792_t:CDS:1 n=1 Tax=Acaulospora morrowiae TaxID=94023 RepID=A0A9N8YML4_9GLOM|nr:6792_t:CDS:10 [Acaulospora morrowiae]